MMWQTGFLIKNSVSGLQQKGFTLLEVLLTVVLMSLVLMLVVPTLPTRSVVSSEAGRLHELLTWASNHAVENNFLLGLNITNSGYDLQLLNIQTEPVWQLYSPGRVSTHFSWPKEWYITLSPSGLNKSPEQRPQVIFLPDGQITPFTLQLTDGSVSTWTIQSEGILPVRLQASGKP